MTSDHGTYGIGAVAKMTGLSNHTIRVWERRYEAVVAQRAPNGRRVYTAADVEKLNLLKLLTERGLSIGRIAAETVAELRQRTETMTELSRSTAPPSIAVALLGDFLPARIQRRELDLAPLDFVVVDTSVERFEADVQVQAIDVLILEAPILNADSMAHLRELIDISGAHEAVCIYSFARNRDIERLRDSGVVVLHAPVNPEDLRMAVISAYESPRMPRPAAAAASLKALDSEWVLEGTIEPRRFSQSQIAALANVSTKIDCECPQQLAHLVADLGAFEAYSASCANESEEDAALHRYLHYTTARARAMIEGALERVAKAEGLEY